MILIESLKDIFQKPDIALKTVRNIVREQLYRIGFDEEIEYKRTKLDPKWVDQGTQDWENFSSFIFRRDGIGILFAPYHVSSYADGAQFAEISYEHILPLMQDKFVEALEIGEKIR